MNGLYRSFASGDVSMCDAQRSFEIIGDFIGVNEFLPLGEKIGDECLVVGALNWTIQLQPWGRRKRRRSHEQ